MPQMQNNGTLLHEVNLKISTNDCFRISVTPAFSNRHLSLYHNCDLTTMRLRHDYDEKLTCLFFSSRRIASNGS